MSNSLKIVSLNIEQDKHLDRVIPFLKKQNPDVILLQEVLEKDITLFENALGMNSVFTGMRSVFTLLTVLIRNNEASRLGLLTLSNLPLLKNDNAYYRGNGANIPNIQEGDLKKIIETMPRAIQVTEFVKENKHYCLINTHFTWSPNGQPNPEQHLDLDILLKLLSEIPQFILCGDFNTPRGTVIFDTIASKYKDNIPSEISTTIDQNLHKARNLNLVVDGLFTTPQYQVNSIKIIDGLSDHCAIVAEISSY